MSSSSALSPRVGVVPVGGSGARLRGTKIDAESKLLFRVCGTEILMYPLGALRLAGCSRVYLITTDISHGVITSFARHHSQALSPLRLTVVNANAEGTAHALLSVASFITEPFYYTNGDIIFLPRLFDRLASSHVPGLDLATVVVSSQEMAPTHPHFVLGNGSQAVEVKTSPSASDGALCSLETALMDAAIFRYLLRVPARAMTMEALRLATQEGRSVRLVVSDERWFHLAEPNDVDVSRRPAEVHWIGNVARQLGLQA